MSSQRLALVMLVLGLVAGGLVGSLVGPFFAPPDPGRVHAAEGPLGLTPSDDGRQRAAESGVALAPVATGANEARTSVSGDVEGTLAQMAANRALAEPTPDATAAEADTDWTGRITGVVVDESGRPLSGATVVCDNSQGASTKVARGSKTTGVGRAWKGFDDLDESLVGNARQELERRRNSRTAVTDAAGRFVLEGLRPGQHSLRAYADGLVFPSLNVFAGDPTRFVGRPVGEFHLDVRLPDGSVPAEAVVLLLDERRQETYRWTPEEPVLRLEDRIAQLQVLAGNVRHLEWRSYTSDHSAPSRTIDLARDGKGPHVFELTERSKLRVTLEDLSTLEPRVPAWVKVISARAAQGGATTQSFEDGQKLNREVGQTFSVADLAPGAYVIGAGRGDSAPEVTLPVEISVGTNEASLRLGELAMSRFLIARCTGPDGAPLMGVKFSTDVKQGDNSHSGEFGSVERPGGEYWLAKSELMHQKEWTADTSVRLHSVAKGYGKLATDLAQHAQELALVFQPACDVVVVVTGDVSAGYSVGIEALKETGEDVGQAYFGFGDNKLVRVDGEGRAVLAGLQPGTFRVSLAQTTESYFWGAPVTTTDVVLRPGSQTITITAPTLYDLVVHGPDLSAGTTLALHRVTEGDPVYTDLQAEIGADHRARFTRVPASEYMLQAWDESGGSMRITVPSGEVLFSPEKPNALRVSSVEADKLAARAGLLDGDLVVSVSGHAVDGYMSAQRLYLDIQGSTSVLQVLRGTTQLELTIGPAATAQPWSEVGANFHPTVR